MTGAAGARRRSSFAWVAVVVFALPMAVRAEYRGKGSIVGRLLSESVSEAGASTKKSESSTEAGRVISRDALNALMKRPTEPVYDPLRPMSGRWVRCQDVPAQTSKSAPVVRSRQDRYSSWDRSHFTHIVSFASDKDCKTIVNQERTNYECSSVDKKSLSCKVMKRETKTGGAPWASVKVAANEKPVELSFLGLAKKKKRSAKPLEPRKLEVRLDRESVSLVFEPSSLRAHKTND